MRSLASLSRQGDCSASLEAVKEKLAHFKEKQERKKKELEEKAERVSREALLCSHSRGLA